MPAWKFSLQVGVNRVAEVPGLKTVSQAEVLALLQQVFDDNGIRAVITAHYEAEPVYVTRNLTSEDAEI